MVPMIIFVVPLAISLGWDSLTGLGMSLLPLAFGFASAVTNPSPSPSPQRIADLPLFSGSWLRIIFFFAVYLIVTSYVIRYAKKVRRIPDFGDLQGRRGDPRALRRWPGGRDPGANHPGEIAVRARGRPSSGSPPASAWPWPSSCSRPRLPGLSTSPSP
jgi:hypothetical protein